MSSLTRFLGRLIGLFLILFSLAMVSHKQATLEAVTTLLHDPSALLILAMILLSAGLAIVIAHNVWSGGALPVIVTLVGWLMLIRGLILLFLSPATVIGLFRTLQFEHLFYWYFAIPLILGAYMTYSGFRSNPR
jgi:hypothetical protein